MKSRALMVLGTASHVGKSVITAGLGRILSDEGIRVAPFKAQNMSLNSATTPDEREIGRAQALQAEACRIAPTVEMNPVLIKPRSDSSSQIMVLGRIWGQLSAADYHMHRVEEIFPAVLESYEKLAAQYEVMLLEGAGSPAEINLREHDIVNLRMARAANANCLLVGDIDRGGVFASLLGTMELLDPEEKTFIRGFIINKFRGDISLLRPGVEMIERRLGLPCVGVVPHLSHMGLDEEDGVAMSDRRTPRRIWREKTSDSPDRPLRIGVVALPHMSNFTDFDALASEPSVALAFLEQASDVSLCDVLILPGTKQTLDDMGWLAVNHFIPAIHEHHSIRRPIIGICGGFQMLGLKVLDPSGIENDGLPAEQEGLKLLPVTTVLHEKKTTRPVCGKICFPPIDGHSWPNNGFRGYEIHVGTTQLDGGAQPFAKVSPLNGGAETFDGAVGLDGIVMGTYVHGIFDTDLFRHSFLDVTRSLAGLSPVGEKHFATAERERRINRWADHLRASLDMPLIRSWIE